MNKLKYCPFCGHDGPEVVIVPYPMVCYFSEEHDNTRTEIYSNAAVLCTHCAAQGGSHVEEFEKDAVDAAVHDWNGAKRIEWFERTFICPIRSVWYWFSA